MISGSDFHVSNAVPPKGLKITGIWCWMWSSPFVHRVFSRFSESFDWFFFSLVQIHLLVLKLVKMALPFLCCEIEGYSNQNLQLVENWFMICHYTKQSKDYQLQFNPAQLEFVDKWDNQSVLQSFLSISIYINNSFKHWFAFFCLHKCVCNLLYHHR